LAITSAPAEAKPPQTAGAAAFELLQRAATAMAHSTLVPDTYKGNVPNCMIALRIAQRIGADPLMVVQNLDIVHGRPSWRAQFLIATVNACGRFSAIRYEFFGEQGKDAWGCRAWAIEKATGEKLVGPDITIGIARADGWLERKGSKWKTMPQLMLMYRAGAWWARVNAPELSLGFQTSEEIRDVIDATARGDGSYSVEAMQRGAAQLGAPKIEDGPDHHDDDGVVEEETASAPAMASAQAAPPAAAPPAAQAQPAPAAAPEPPPRNRVLEQARAACEGGAVVLDKFLKRQNPDALAMIAGHMDELWQLARSTDLL
jgi:hypothetical protein